MESNAPITIEESLMLEPRCPPAIVSVNTTAHYRSDLVSFGWWTIADWSVLAAGVYPLLLSAVGLIVHSVKFLIYGRSSSPFVAAEWFWILLYIPLFSIGCLFWVAMVAVVFLPVLHLVVRSLELRVSFVRLGAFTGGLLIFVATLPISLDWPRMQRNAGWWDVARVLLMGPAAATIVGQIGGAYGGLRATRRAAVWAQARQQLVDRGWRQPAPPVSGDRDDGFDVLANRPRIQFRTVHLLWVAVWISLLLALIRLVGLPFETVLPVVFGWLLCQALTLWIGGIVIRWLGPRWTRRRQGRST